ncbi:carboxylesterase family protein [Hyalangium versicolor]|uniref:carboxylesterase family protein n=1 Tax=Hyalangium versicolor TaxID=2861190 RepID=UPI001CCBEA80|nr:PHB depolymerase family esterase [Hyalangium versicolor]
MSPSMRVFAVSLSLLAAACGAGEEVLESSELRTQESRLSITVEDQVVARLKSSTGAQYSYGEYLPPGYLTSTTNYPVIIHLNGMSEFGTSTTEAALLGVVTRHGAMKKIYNTSAGKTWFGQHQVMVFTPQAPTNWVPAELNTFLDFIIANYRVDTSRIYLTGLSYGGYGSWTYAYAYGSRLAALAPMATNIGAPGPTITQLRNVPVWAVHSYNDGSSFSAETSWMTGLTKNYGVTQPVSVPTPSATLTYLFSAPAKAWTSQAGVVATGDSIARLTVIPGTAHDCWTQIYDNYDFWSWLVAQQRSTTP